MDLTQFASNGTRAVTGSNSWMRLFQNGADTEIQIDPSGPSNGSAYQTVIVLRGVVASTLMKENFESAFSLDGSVANATIAAKGRIVTLDGNDGITTQSSSNVNTGYGNDTIVSGQGGDVVYAGAGKDSFTGSAIAGSKTRSPTTRRAWRFPPRPPPQSDEGSPPDELKDREVEFSKEVVLCEKVEIYGQPDHAGLERFEAGWPVPEIRRELGIRTAMFATTVNLAAGCPIPTAA